MKKKINVAVVGATGLVGRKILQVLEERNFPIESIKLYASHKSAGNTLRFQEKTHVVKDIEASDFSDIDIALFSAGNFVSEKYVPKAAGQGCIVIDNGSFWRMNPEVPLIVPEVNPEMIIGNHGIIANPNCSTIQLVVALKPIADNFGLKRVVVSTYQAISGAGQVGVSQLMSEINGELPESRISSNQLAFNTVFHTIKDNIGFSIEELKMIDETRKILALPKLPLAVTCVRIPVLNGHAESVNIETEKPFTIFELKEVLGKSLGIELVDDPINEVYPTPLMVENKDEVFIGRIRKDESIENGAYLWVVSDNLRKGAATNAVQIAEKVLESMVNG
ncbi:MAG: Aspartate-semialdehyde dehydrogenase [Ignavibacteria bacterium]|nr:Aspartate-semialdehyde dehydrogenase [Ignavibacteria bacterium]